MYVPGEALALAVNVTVVPEVLVDGLKEAVMPVGRPMTLNVTDPEKFSPLEREIAAVAGLPNQIVAVEGELETVKPLWPTAMRSLMSPLPVGDPHPVTRS